MVVLDGESHTGHMREAVDIRYQSGFPNVIIVGVENVDRGRDLTFAPGDEAPNGGGADTFLAHLSSELLPYLDANYRTSGHVTLFGHSAAGLFGAYALVHEPDLFDAYILASPTLRWADFQLVEPLRTALAGRTETIRLHLSWGSETGAELEGFEAFAAALGTASDAVVHEIAPDVNEDHNTIPYLSAFKGLRTVYAPFIAPDGLIAAPLPEIRNHYQQVALEYGVSSAPPQRLLLDRGFMQKADGDITGSIATFELFADLYEGNPLPLILLAESYEEAGRLDEALATLRQSADIMIWPPDLNERIARLEQLVDG